MDDATADGDTIGRGSLPPSADGGAEPGPLIDRLPGEEFVREVAATAQQTTILRHALAEWLQPRGMSAPVVEDILLAATEAMANVVDHAYPDDPDGTLLLTAGVEPGFLTITVVDTGRWDEKPSPAGRGRGIAIIRALAPETAITSTPTGTTVRLTWPWTADI